MNNTRIAQKIASYLEEQMSSEEKEYMPVGQTLVEDILDWMSRTSVTITVSDDMHWLTMQYENNA